MALTPATTLGDGSASWRALKANLSGVGLALVMSAGVGLFVQAAANVPAIGSRVQLSGSDVLLALASGVAAALAITSQVPSALIGVMVALALMPPLVVFGLMLATGQFHAALGALLLLATNVICVNLTGVLTFRLLGIFPRNWWEAERARRATRRALTTWLALMTILIAVLILELAPGR